MTTGKILFEFFVVTLAVYVKYNTSYLKKKFDTVCVFKMAGNMDGGHFLGGTRDGGGMVPQK